MRKLIILSACITSLSACTLPIDYGTPEWIPREEAKKVVKQLNTTEGTSCTFTDTMVSNGSGQSHPYKAFMMSISDTPPNIAPDIYLNYKQFMNNTFFCRAFKATPSMEEFYQASHALLTLGVTGR